MLVTKEIEEPKELNKLLSFFKKLKLEKVKIISQTNGNVQNIKKGNKTLDSTSLFGIWKQKPRTLKEIRKAAWEKFYFTNNYNV